MKSYKDLQAFIKRCKAQDGQAKINIWSDTIRLAGKTFKMTSYGTMYNGRDYATWENKNGYTLNLEYDCPSWNKGELTKPFKYYKAELY